MDHLHILSFLHVRSQANPGLVVGILAGANQLRFGQPQCPNTTTQSPSRPRSKSGHQRLAQQTLTMSGDISGCEVCKPPKALSSKMAVR